MARNGNGQYTLPAGNPVLPGTTISTEWANTTLNDIATALTGSVASDGQTPMSGTLDMSNNKIKNLINGTDPQDAATVNQISNPAITGGTINGAPIGITNPKDGNFLALSANTGEFSDGLTAPTVTPATDNTNKVATTAFVQSAISAVSSGVTSFNGRSGAVILQPTDVTNALGYTPYNAGTNTVVTSANVLDYTVGKTGQGATGNWGISISGNAASANKANTVDTITSNQVTTALGYVPLTPSSPAMQGTPTAPTAPVGTNTTQVATCAFVLANQGGGGGAVQSVNGKTGAVVLNAADVGAYASNNPSGYTTLSAVQAQGYTTLATVQSQGYLTGSTGVTTGTAQTITGAKTFTGGITSQAYNFSGTSSIAFNSSTNAVQVTANGVSQAVFKSGGIDAGLFVLTNEKSGILPDASIRYGNSGSTMYYSDFSWSCSVDGSLKYKLKSDGTAFKPGGGAWADISDQRLKSDVQTLNTCLDTINALNPVMFTWKMASRVKTGAPEVGFIADEVEKVIPSAVTEYTPISDEKLDTISKGIKNPQDQEIIDLLGEDVPIKVIGWKNDIFAYLVGAIKELSAKVDDLQTQINALKK